MGDPPGDIDLPALHDGGTGPPLLLLHAFPQDASMWDHQVAALRGRYRCLRPDAFGCGSSPPPPAGLTIEGWAAAVLAALDRVAAGRVAVAGASMGGYLALALLRAAPERLAGICLIGSRAGADGDGMRADRVALAARLRSDGDRAVEDLAESQPGRQLSRRSLDDFHISDPVRGRIRRCTPTGLAALAELLARRPDSSAQLSTIAVPTLVVAGAEDALVPMAQARAMATAIPAARFEVVEGCGHLVGLERPHLVSGLLEEWLGRLSWAA
ncbi:MAG TPA: alpha/beta fold hydrolase [Candidatus Dormibacteraeota bacterium]